MPAYDFSRQQAIEEFDESVMQRLRDLRLVQFGCGGLGAYTAPLLHGLGLGHLTVVDDDCVALSNLARQQIFRHADIGRHKAEVLRDFLAQRHGFEVEIAAQPHDTAAWQALIAAHDWVLDCTDAHAASLQINAACVAQNVPCVFANVQAWAGQIMLYRPQQACFACLWQESVKASQNAPVLGNCSAGVAWLASAQVLLWLNAFLCTEDDTNAAQKPNVWLLNARDCSTTALSLAPRATCACQK